MARIRYRKPKLVSIKNPNTYEINDNLLLSGLFSGSFESPTPLLLGYYGHKRKKKIEKYIFIYQLLLSYGIYAVRILRSMKLIRPIIKVKSNKYLVRVLFSLMRKHLYKMYRRVLLLIWESNWLPRSLRRLIFSLMSRKKMRVRRFFKIRKVFKKWLRETSRQLSFLTPIKGTDFDSPSSPKLSVSRIDVLHPHFSTYVCFLTFSFFRNMSIFNFYLQKANWFGEFVKALAFVYNYKNKQIKYSLQKPRLIRCVSLKKLTSLSSMDNTNISSVGLLFLEQQLQVFGYNTIGVSGNNRCVIVPFLLPEIYKYWWHQVKSRVHA